MKTTVISAFPGTGKTHFYNNEKFTVLDSDSSKFSWLNGERNPDFPQNYIQHIKGRLGRVQIILVSSHKEVREELSKAGIKFWLLYPELSLKSEYIDRYKKRGDTLEFIDMMSNNWDKFIQDMQSQTGCIHLPMSKGRYISDYLWELFVGDGALFLDKNGKIIWDGCTIYNALNDPPYQSVEERNGELWFGTEGTDDWEIMDNKKFRFDLYWEIKEGEK